MEPYVSAPLGRILSIPPGYVEYFSVAVRPEAFRLAKNGPFIDVAYRLEYEDGFGIHRQLYAMGMFVGGLRRAIGVAKNLEADSIEHLWREERNG